MSACRQWLNAYSECVLQHLTGPPCWGLLLYGRLWSSTSSKIFSFVCLFCLSCFLFYCTFGVTYCDWAPSRFLSVLWKLAICIAVSLSCPHRPHTQRLNSEHRVMKSVFYLTFVQIWPGLESVSDQLTFWQVMQELMSEWKHAEFFSVALCLFNTQSLMFWP